MTDQLTEVGDMVFLKSAELGKVQNEEGVFLEPIRNGQNAMKASIQVHPFPNAGPV